MRFLRVFQPTLFYISKAQQSGNAEYKILEPWEKWFQRISHLNGITFKGRLIFVKVAVT